MHTPDHGFDRLLDRSVVLGYSSIGYALRRRFGYPADPSPDSLAGRRALVTGAASGLGEAAALGLARLGADVHLLARSEHRAEPAAARIAERLEGEGRTASIELEVCDVSDLDAVRAFSAEFAAKLSSHSDHLDVLVHNAGVMPQQRVETAEGHELTVATHILGPLLMTELLRPVLSGASGGSRVIFVASGGMYAQRLHAEDPDFRGGEYKGAEAYARSKRMQVELVRPLAERWSADGIRAYAMHPGWVDTPGISDSLPGFSKLAGPVLRDASAGADTIVWLSATDPAPIGGGFWHDRSERPRSYLRATRPEAESVEALLSWSLDAVGIDPND